MMSEPSLYERRKTRYGHVLTLLLLLTILHLIGMVLVQSFTKINDAGDGFVTSPVFGLMFASSGFALLLTSASYSLKSVLSSSSIITLALSLLLLFFQYDASKGKHAFLYVASCLYLVDSLFLLPDFILLHHYPIPFSWIDVLLFSLLHLAGVVLYVIATVLAFRLQQEEKNKPAHNEVDPHQGL